jgi:hypothetical protein
MVNETILKVQVTALAQYDDERKSVKKRHSTSVFWSRYTSYLYETLTTAAGG